MEHCLLYLLLSYIKKNKIIINDKKIISLSLLIIMIITYFLPCIHDRYLILGDILSIIWFIMNNKKIYVPLFINTLSFTTYCKFLLNKTIINYNILSILYFLLILCYLKNFKQKKS